MDHNHIKRQIFEQCHYGNHLTDDGNSNDDDGGPKMLKTKVNSVPVNILANGNTVQPQVPEDKLQSLS